MSFKDLFSTQSSDYARFRPTYPAELFTYLSSLSSYQECAWDCGTGNGQAAVALAKYFKKVIATDPSEKQLSQAIRKSNIDYRQAPAEKTDIPEASIDLITVAQAFHWFRQEDFFKEVRRVSKSQTHLAIFGYSTMEATPEIKAVVRVLFSDILESYWEKERKIVDAGYKNEQIPFQEISPPNFVMSSHWSFENLIGYLNTWSAVQTYIRQNNKNPVELIYEDLKKAWGSADERHLQWKFDLRVFKID